MTIGRAFQHVLEVSERLHGVELCRGQQRGDDCPSRRAAIGASEEVVLTAEGNRADGAFDSVGDIRGKTAETRQGVRRINSLPLVGAMKTWLGAELARVPPRGGVADAPAPATTFTAPALSAVSFDAERESDSV